MFGVVGEDKGELTPVGPNVSLSHGLVPPISFLVVPRNLLRLGNILLHPHRYLTASSSRTFFDLYSFTCPVTVVAEVVVVLEPTSTTLEAVRTELGSCLRAGPASVPPLRPRTHSLTVPTARVRSGSGGGILGN